MENQSPKARPWDNSRVLVVVFVAMVGLRVRLILARLSRTHGGPDLNIFYSDGAQRADPALTRMPGEVPYHPRPPNGPGFPLL